MVAVKELKYIVVGGRDLDAWTRFATEGLGLGVSARDENTLHLRCDRMVSRLQVVKSDYEDLHALGWGVGSQAELDQFAIQLKEANIPYEDISGEKAFARRVLRLLRFQDPDNNTHEVTWGNETNDATKFRSSVVVDGFATEEHGLGHAVLSIANMDVSRKFFCDVLGHKVTSHLFVHGFEAIFLRCNARHHSVAISVSNRVKKLQHLQVEYNSFDDIGRALDRVEDLDIPVVATLGKHVSDFVTSFYVSSPSGITVEIGYGARLMAEDAPTEFENFTGSIWGHRKGMENA